MGRSTEEISAIRLTPWCRVDQWRSQRAGERNGLTGLCHIYHVEPLQEKPSGSSRKSGLALGRTTAPVWHYTDVAGLLGIVRSRSIWASAPQVLNDSSEVLYGVNLVRDAWAEQKSNSVHGKFVTDFIDQMIGELWVEYVQKRVFIASTSREPDLLSQWRNYANSDGYAICLDTSGRWGRRPEMVNGQLELRTTVLHGWYDVMYDEPTQKQAAAQLAETLPRLIPSQAVEEDSVAAYAEAMAMGFLLISALPLSMKHPAFADEREARFIGGSADAGVAYRAANGRIVPYAPIGVFAINDQGHVLEQEQPFPIVKILCGPGCRDGTPSIVRRFLESEGFDGVEVSASVLPFTG